MHFNTYFLNFTFSKSLRVALITIIAILLMSAKLATPVILKTNVYWNKRYHFIIYFNNVTNKNLSRDSNYIVDMMIWPKFGNSSISETLWWHQSYKGLTRKNELFEGMSWLKLNHLRPVLDIALEFYISVAKDLNLKVRITWGLIPTFEEVLGENLVTRPFVNSPLTILNRVKSTFLIEHLLTTASENSNVYTGSCPKLFLNKNITKNFKKIQEIRKTTKMSSFQYSPRQHKCFIFLTAITRMLRNIAACCKTPSLLVSAKYCIWYRNQSSVLKSKIMTGFCCEIATLDWNGLMF